MRLFLDPLASALAGPAAIHESVALAAPWPLDSSSVGRLAAHGNTSADESPGQGGHERRRFCYSNVGVSMRCGKRNQHQGLTCF